VIIVLRAELVKLKRSSTWLVAFVLPLLAVITGTVNYARNADLVGPGWASFTSQVVLFYGLLFFSMGVSVLAATVWRVEHRGTNWNLLLTATRQPVRLVLAKVVAVTVPVCFMQGVLVLATLVSGVAVLGLPGGFPWRFALVGALAVVAALPLVALQSLLSMLLRSFAAPVAICFVGCVVAVAAVTSTGLRPLAHVLPQAITTRAINLGSSAIAQSGALTVADALPILLTAVALAAVLTLAGAAAIRGVKLR
jgi:hypothetical protein